MAGVSPQLIDLRKRISDNLEQDKAELASVNAELAALGASRTELTIRAEALERSVSAGERLLSNAAPKQVRRKKTEKSKPQTLGEQMGTDATVGQP